MFVRSAQPIGLCPLKYQLLQALTSLSDSGVGFNRRAIHLWTHSAQEVYIDSVMATEKPAESKPPGDEYWEMYKLFHEERVSLADEARKLEIAAITAVAALYAWLATHHVHGAPWYIGMPLVFLATIRAALLGERILFMKEYLKSVEAHVFGKESNPPGYETYFSANAPWYAHIRISMIFIWVALLVVTYFAPRFLDK